MAIECSSLEHISNGSVEVEGGRIARYSCNMHFILSGPTERICQQDGEWSNRDPICGEEF